MKIKVLITALIIITILISGCLESPSGPSKKTIVIGSKLFQESYILAHMISLLLEDHGYKTNVKEGLGSTFVNYEAMRLPTLKGWVSSTVSKK